jgi:hypothetical protein
MKGKRHTPEQIIAKLREADALLTTAQHRSLWSRYASFRLGQLSL